MKVPLSLMPWLPHFQEAARRYKLDVALLMAICLHESAGGATLTPPGPAGTGDEGHGRGLMQVDDRYHKDFIAKTDAHGTPLWQLPRENILEGARILREECLNAFPGEEGLGVIAYNRGAHAVHRTLKGLPPGATPAQRFAEADKGSKRGNYGRSILARRVELYT